VWSKVSATTCRSLLDALAPAVVTSNNKFLKQRGAIIDGWSRDG
jgi:hypothetical protein